ncbi:hypothetical protein SCATT_07780 [Streptantibioticus cattleyicolor NRRL 8057 = DSM 46488]|uniref:Uncharacterized protein n=1 Tax=Streptantibioticus cattleyicolor (strain ATCC 35852 / DSM 46488 / JCM 4925 / NBRC 14057 / NRRL 8057) TaxID=1003195 RepID=G8WYW4_STREN|nr:hypothetical protein SCATT_07780 [Streptantibioticus cattleyicolor NRRL 8057 = DSM 46488]
MPEVDGTPRDRTRPATDMTGAGRAEDGKVMAIEPHAPRVAGRAPGPRPAGSSRSGAGGGGGGRHRR